MGRVQRAVSLGRLKPEDVTAEDVEQHLYTKVAIPAAVLDTAPAQKRPGSGWGGGLLALCCLLPPNPFSCLQCLSPLHLRLPLMIEGFL